MEILIDNKDLKSVYGITTLDYTGALSYPSTRDDEIEWADKSGVDPNLENIRFDTKEFIMKFLVEADNPLAAYNIIKVLTDYMLSKRVFVLSLRDTANNVREAFLCERSNTIIPDINIRQQNSLFVFKLGFKDINPNTLVYQTAIIGNEVTINYEKGQNAIIYWGDGTRGEVNNSGNYTKNDYTADGLIDIIVDIDKNAVAIVPLIADFTGTPLSGLVELSVQFTDTSSGGPVLWSWDFGDGNGSTEQNPLHTYNIAGTYTVTLQIFNEASGSAVESKTNYVTVTFPDFDANISTETLTAVVSAPFTFELLAKNSSAPLAGHFIITLKLNGVATVFDFPNGTIWKDVQVIKTFPDIEVDSYLELSCNDADTLQWLFQNGTLKMENAGLKKLNLYGDYGFYGSSNPYLLKLNGNGLPEDQINILLEAYEDTVNEASPANIIFDISGGTNAIPTSATALLVKADLIADQTYYDNE